MNKLQAEDIQRAVEIFPFDAELQNSSFLITGATGLIGKCLVNFLLALKAGVSVTIPVRSRAKAEALFGVECPNLKIIECDLQEFSRNVVGEFDYVVHCASPTNGAYMSAHPADLYIFTIETTKNLLEYARNHKCKGFVYLSSVEFYGQILSDKLGHTIFYSSGQILSDDVIDETSMGYIDFDSPRSSYPMAKQGAEYLCKAYAAQYGVAAKTARLTQTFGAGVEKDDNRVFAQFARSIINNQDIVLHTSGESAKPYCYTADAVCAILYILLKGENGHAYNVANKDTYISIIDLARFLRDKYNPAIDVKIDLHPEYQYAPPTKLRLSVAELESLGWKPTYSLSQMFDRLILDLKDE